VQRQRVLCIREFDEFCAKLSACVGNGDLVNISAVQLRSSGQRMPWAITSFRHCHLVLRNVRTPNGPLVFSIAALKTDLNMLIACFLKRQFSRQFSPLPDVKIAVEPFLRPHHKLFVRSGETRVSARKTELQLPPSLRPHADTSIAQCSTHSCG